MMAEFYRTTRDARIPTPAPEEPPRWFAAAGYIAVGAIAMWAFLAFGLGWPRG